MADDLISRQAAINEVKSWKKAFLNTCHNQSASDTMFIMGGIKTLPPAQPEYQEMSSSDVAISMSPVSVKSAIWWLNVLEVLEKAGYVICYKKAIKIAENSDQSGGN